MDGDRDPVVVLDEVRAGLSTLVTSAQFAAGLDDVPDGARGALALVEAWASSRLMRALLEQDALLQAEVQR